VITSARLYAAHFSSTVGSLAFAGRIGAAARAPFALRFLSTAMPAFNSKQQTTNSKGLGGSLLFVVCCLL
jgi:hypothetical protein